MSGCHEPSDEPKLLTDLRAMADDILSLIGQIEGLGEKINDHWDLNYKSQENLSKRLSKLDDQMKTVHHDLKDVSEWMLDKTQKFISLEAHIDNLHDMINMEDRITACDVLNRITLLESSKLTKELDPQVWKHIAERLDKLESATSMLDLMIKAKEFGVQMEEGNRYGECLAGLELKLQDKIADVIRIMVKDDTKLENGIDQVKNELSKEIGLLEARFREIERYQDVTNAQHRLFVDRKVPHKCPVCDGKYIAMFKECESACLACDKGIVWG